jgi:hypothetical protein
MRRTHTPPARSRTRITTTSQNDELELSSPVSDGISGGVVGGRDGASCRTTGPVVLASTVRRVTTPANAEVTALGATAVPSAAGSTVKPTITEPGKSLVIATCDLVTPKIITTSLMNAARKVATAVSLLRSISVPTVNVATTGKGGGAGGGGGGGTMSVAGGTIGKTDGGEGGPVGPVGEVPMRGQVSPTCGCEWHAYSSTPFQQHVPPVAAPVQGFDAHSSMSVVQSLPDIPAGQFPPT